MKYKYMKYIFILFIIILLFIFLYIYWNKQNNKEYFYINTWTPYVIDLEYQPGFSNYFYNNGYMYPVF
jgi:hypothetical protein